MNTMPWYITRLLEEPDIMRKVSGEEVRQNITRYGLPDNATADVKSIAEIQEKEMETVAEKETHYHRGR